MVTFCVRFRVALSKTLLEIHSILETLKNRRHNTLLKISENTVTKAINSYI